MFHISKNDLKPYSFFYDKYDEALKANQKNIEAIAISSFDSKKKEVDSRYVNLKYIENEDWVFFSNYQSPKAKQFKTSSRISVLIYWNSIDTQIRIKADIKKLSEKKSDEHFKNRSREKNALAVSSNQSKKIGSYEEVIQNYNKVLNDHSLKERPQYWGGFLFKPYYFEYWEGHEHRLNKRKVFVKNDGDWNEFFLQP